MRVTQPPSQFIDESDGQLIEEVSPVGSRYEVIAVKQLDDGIEVRAIEDGTDRINEFRAALTDQRFRGVAVEDLSRRDIDDDIQDIVHMLGYTLIDKSIKSY